MEGALGLEADFRLRRGDTFLLDVKLSIPPGETHALLGPNGAGKTTAVAAVSGLLAIDHGRIELKGTILDEAATGRFVFPEARHIGVVFQDYLLFSQLTVLENIAFGLRSRGATKEIARDRSIAWLSRMGLTDLARRSPKQLSGGQAQRVALARALVTEPDLLLLDEPLSALDVSTRVQLRRVLAEHLDQFPGPRLLITHDPTEAFLLADQVHVIENGAITQSGSADDIRLRPRTQYVADLAGSNLFLAVAQNGAVEVDGHPLQVAGDFEGDVMLTIRPSAVSVHRQKPEGSPRNAWTTTIELIEHLGERVRLRTGPPLPLTVEITERALVELGLAEEQNVWVAIKATEIGVESG